MIALRRSWLLVALLALAACGPDGGSEEDLAAQFERLPFPADARQVGESYEECPSDANDMTVCPTLRRWYEIDGGPDRVRDALEALTDEGFEIDVDPDSTMVTDGDYVILATFGADARDAEQAPERADLEIEVSPVPDF